MNRQQNYPTRMHLRNQCDEILLQPLALELTAMHRMMMMVRRRSTRSFSVLIQLFFLYKICENIGN